MRTAKQFLVVSAAFILAVGTFTVVAPKTAHAIVASLVQVTNTAANPVATQAVGTTAVTGLVGIDPQNNTVTVANGTGTPPPTQALFDQVVGLSPTLFGVSDVIDVSSAKQIRIATRLINGSADYVLDVYLVDSRGSRTLLDHLKDSGDFHDVTRVYEMPGTKIQFSWLVFGPNDVSIQVYGRSN
jgi:hypothetical protein